ncbi:MAG: ribonuclease H-like domain-containing protein [Lentisphaeria bacterium]
MKTHNCGAELHPSYIYGAFLHFSHIGRKRRGFLLKAGIDSWQELPECCPEELCGFQTLWNELWQEAVRYRQQIARGDWACIASAICSSERWRLLADCWKKVVYLDIETSGVDASSEVTTISCWDGKNLRLFLQGENLDDFLDYAETVSVFATFNGASFDMPKLCRCFHVPELFRGIHVDLRWVFYHAGWTGGLKSIEKQLGIQRPDDLQETDGLEAIDLWEEWRETKNVSARQKLLRYCAADTITLRQAAAKLLSKLGGLEMENPELSTDAWKCLNRQYPSMKRPQKKKTIRTAMPDRNRNDKKESIKSTDPDIIKMQMRLKSFLNRLK